MPRFCRHFLSCSCHSCVTSSSFPTYDAGATYRTNSNSIGSGKIVPFSQLPFLPLHPSLPPTPKIGLSSNRSANPSTFNGMVTFDKSLDGKICDTSKDGNIEEVCKLLDSDADPNCKLFLGVSSG